jgi:stress response protein YsnF
MVESHGDQQEARAILQRYGAYDARRAETSHNPYGQMGEDYTIPIREEVLLAHKQSVQIGEVIIRKEVITEEKTITVPISREELVIEHLPVPAQPSDQLGRDRSSDPLRSPQPPVEGQKLEEALKKGETLRIVLREEQIRVEKYPVVKEEVFISKRQRKETKHVSDTLKREEIHIERVGNVPIREKGEDKPS